MGMLLEKEVSRSVTASVNEDVERGRADLCVEREDIQFYNVAPDRLRIGVLVHNRRDVPSRPETMRLQFAAFGAFVPWTPLQELRVPRIRAGGSRLVSTEAMIREDGSLVAIDGRVRSALSREEVLPKKFKKIKKFTSRNLDRDRAVLRVPYSGRSVNWIGNINVLIGNVDVERHMARAFRIYPDCLNRCMFFVGDKPAGESYCLHASGSGVEWPMQFSMMSDRHRMRTFQRFASGWEMSPDSMKPIQPGAWFPADPYSCVGVEISPPEDATEGSLSIEVCRRSDDRRAVVEFDFSAAAAGPGCYTVA